MTRFLALLTCVAVLLANAGCSTMNGRIKEHEAMFRTLEPATQQRLREQRVEIGDTADMVYIALGRPTSRTERKSKDGTTMVWTYSVRGTEYAGTAVGHRRAVVIDPRTGRRMLIVQPVVANVYQETEEDLIRVEFKEGLVSAVETADE